jgi:mannose-6-phosphate isomerase
MSHTELYPLKFEPLYQYRIWGGRRLENLLSKPLPKDENIGEAWILSDRKDQPSIVSEGLFKGRTIADLMTGFPRQLMGDAAGLFDRFPLLLKFLDAQTVLSVQVHPSDDMTEYIPEGEQGKTEAWVVLEANENSKIYAGLKPGTTPEKLKAAFTNHNIAELLPHFNPDKGDAVFIHAGTVHTIDDVLVFEIQENSDITYRLYDWDRIDQKTGSPRPLQVDKAMACINFAQGEIQPVRPEREINFPVKRELLFNCSHFIVWRNQGASPFPVGEMDLPRVLVCLEGDGHLKYDGGEYALNKGEVMLLPAVAGICSFEPRSEVTLLEIALPRNLTHSRFESH